jgi:hypothetical protein
MEDRLSEDVTSEDVMLDAALRTAPEVRIPANFRQRLMTRLPEVQAGPRRRRWFWPALGVFGLISFVILAEAALQLGVQRWLVQPSMLLTILALEVVLSLVVLWRATAA